MRKAGARWLLAAAVSVGLAGCSGVASDKAGNDVLVLHLATIDLVNNNGYSFGPAEFVRALDQVSGDRIRVDVETAWGDGTAHAEADLITAIARGDIDGGWPPTRAFAAAGIAGLAGFEAPFAIPSYAAERAVVRSEAAAQALTRLRGTGLVGLGLTVGPLRRPFAAEGFLTSPADFDGTIFRTYGSATQAAAVEALGGTPRSIGETWAADIRDGALDAAEFDLAQYLANNYRRLAPYVTSNVVLWPKMYLLTLSEARWSKLTDQQQAWIREAADRAVEASVTGDYAESEIAQRLCRVGVRFRDAEASDLLALKAAVAPVLRQLADDPYDGPVLAHIREAAGENPRPEPIILPASCRSGLPTSDASVVPATLAPVPDGTYRKQITEDDVPAAGLTNNDGISGTWTLTVADGRYQLRCRPLASPGLDCGHSTYDGPLDVGELRGNAHVLWWVYQPARLAAVTGCKLPPSDTDSSHCPRIGAPFSVSWNLHGDELVFSNATGGSAEVTLKPFLRIG